MPCRGLEGLQTTKIWEASGHALFSKLAYEYVKELSFAKAPMHHHNKGVGSHSSLLFESTPYGRHRPAPPRLRPVLPCPRLGYACLGARACEAAAPAAAVAIGSRSASAGRSAIARYR